MDKLILDDFGSQAARSMTFNNDDNDFDGPFSLKNLFTQRKETV